MDSFIPSVSKIYDIEIYEVKDRKIDEARNMIVDYFMSKDFEYILFLDDDHSEHTLDMLEALLRCNTPVCAIKCYSRFFPYLPNLLDYSGLDIEVAKYKVKDDINSGSHICDLVGFGMTLVKKEVFELIDKPYFLANNNQKEDNYFCDKLHKVGIKPIGLFDYCLPHQGINEELAFQLKEQGMKELTEKIRKEIPNFEHLVLVT